MRLPAPEDLPKVSFRRIDDDLSKPVVGVGDGLARSFGYCDGSDFERPVHYIRHTETLENDLLRQVEYDMDEQDQDWLAQFNVDRKKEQADIVTPEIFEVILDQLEKEWFLLMKRVPKPDMDLPAEDSTCAVCDDGEGENSNAIVFCDGCNLAVHQDCYGVPYIPEGQWLCRKCTVSPEIPVSCVLCPNEGGAFKQTGAGKWAHLLCAIWIPEVIVTNQLFMEPIEQIERIPKTRWRLRCMFCKETKGACIQCNLKSCFTAFHVTCARKAKLLCTMKTLPGQEEQPLRAYCERHLPKDMQDARSHMLESLGQKNDEQSALRKSTKAARAYARTYKTGPPLVPAYIVDKVSAYISKVSLRKKANVVLSICKYWSLKREARRGAPLLKRLHLEPWTATPTVKQQTDEDRRQKLDHLERIRDDLEKVQRLIEQVQKRESEKVNRVQNIEALLARTLFPHEAKFRGVLNKISDMDTKDKFRQLPSRNDNPEYYERITQPISWVMVYEKLDSHDYWDIDEFKADINRVFDNAIAFYPHEHELNRTATRFKRISAPALNSLDCYGQAEDQYVLGQLEPSLDVVNLFFDTLALQTNVDTIMNEGPISLLISDCRGEYQRSTPSTPPHLSDDPTLQPTRADKATNGVDPTAPLPEQSNSQGTISSPPSPSKPKRIRDRKAERERREQKLAVQAAQAAENVGKLASLARTRRGMPTRSTANIEAPTVAEPIDAVEPTAAAAPIEEEKADIPTQSTDPQPVEPASVSLQPVDSPAQPDYTSTSQPNVLLDLQPTVALPTQTPKQEPSTSPQSPFQTPHVEYTFHHWAPQLNNPPRAPEPQPERHFQPDFQPIFHHSQQRSSFHYGFLPSQALPTYHHSQLPHSNPVHPHQYQQPPAHHQSIWSDSGLFSETSQQYQHPSAFSIGPSLPSIPPRQVMPQPTYSSPQLLPRNPPIMTPTLLSSPHFSRYAAPIPSIPPTHHLPPLPGLNPNQIQTAGMAGAPHQHISISHPVWTTSSQPGSPDRDGKKRKRSEYERPIQIPAVLESVDKKDEFAHFEQGWVLPEGSRRTRQVPMIQIRTDPTVVLPTSKYPERRATNPKRSHVSVIAANEPHANPSETVSDQRSEKKLSKSEKLKLRKLKDKERNQKRRDKAKREKEALMAMTAGGGMGYSGAAAFPPGLPDAGPDTLAPGTTSGELGATDHLTQPPLDDIFGGETSSLSSLSDSEDERPPTTADTQPSAPTDGYRTTNSRGSTLSPLPPSPLPRMSMRDRTGKFTATMLQAQDHIDSRDPTIESEQSKEPGGRNRSRAALGSPPEAGPDGKLEGGTLVWAKQEGHPWFPAVIHDGTEEEIPLRVQEAKGEICSTMTVEERNTLQVVRFYDKAFNWGYVPLRWIRLLFEDDARDKYLLNGKFRNHTVRSQVRAAFRRAMAEKAEAGGEDDAEEEHADNA